MTGAGGPPPWRRILQMVPGAVLADLRRHDVLLVAAGLTFYAAVAAVPLLLLAGRLASAVVGQDRVLALAGSLEEALPSAMGAGSVASGLVVQASSVSWWVALFAVLPASLYGEGLRRAYAALAGAGGAHERFPGWRGRLAVLPVLAAAPLLLLAVLALTPLLARLFERGAGSTALGVYLALTVDWVVVSLPLTWTFRVVSPDPPPWRVAVAGGFATGAFVSGFLQGFVLFLSLPVDLGTPFGGLSAVGGVTAVLLWLLLLHLVVLVGYLATRQAHRLRGTAGPAVFRTGRGWRTPWPGASRRRRRGSGSPRRVGGS